MWGAGGFGLLIGWYVYYINRYRKGDVQFSDLVTLVGVIGGGTVTALFPMANSDTTKPDLFGAYGVGLAIGFFGYFLVLLAMVGISPNFDIDWFLDGRRKALGPGDVIPDGTRQSIVAMDQVQHAGIAAGAAAGAVAAALRTGAGLSGVVPVGASGDAPQGVPATARRIIDACEAAWPANKSDCNAFAKAVGAAFGIQLTGQADDIVDQMKGADWMQVPDGVAAASLAATGLLVLAGLKGSEQAPPVEHGHVAVVTAGPLAFGRYPTAFWGSLRGEPGDARTLNWAWAKPDRDEVHYAARTT